MYFISSLSFGSLHSSLSLTMSSQPLPPGPTLTVSVSALYRSNPGASWSLHWIPLEKIPSSLGTVSITFVFWCRWSIELFVSESRQGAHPKLWFQVVPLVFSPSHIDSFGSLNWKTRRVTILAWGFHFCSILEHAHFFWFYYYYFFLICACSVALQCPTVCDPARLLCLWNLPSKNIRLDCHFQLQGIFPTQGIKPPSPVSPALAGEFFTTG